MINTVPCEAVVAMRITTQLVHQCPFRDEEDRGEVEINWTTAGQTIELHSLTGWLAGYAPVRTSHEEITGSIHFTLSNLEGIRGVQVTTRWTTAGAQVEVTRALPGERLQRHGA